MGRRSFLGGAAWSGVAATAAIVGFDLLGKAAPAAQAAETGPLTGTARADAAQQVRVQAAAFQRGIPLPDHPANTDESLPGRWASYSKILRHNDDGTVVTTEYDKLLTALASGNPADFETIQTNARKLVNPQAAYAYALEGADSHAFSVPAAPAAGSAQTQAEMAELYWMALARDIPFDSYATDGSGIINAAISDLNSFADVTSPRVNGAITTGSLFRDKVPDNLTGNFISQFLLLDVPWGPQRIIQKNRRRPAGEDWMTTFPSWLAVQRGTQPAAVTPDNPEHFLRNGRDLAEWVHTDFPAQAAINAARIIAGQGSTGDGKYSPGIADTANPYNSYSAQIPFVTFGNQAFIDLVTRVMQLALQAAWYQKWLVHRRLRPEEYGGRVDSRIRNAGTFDVGAQLLASLADPARLGRVSARWSSNLLPQAFPEGSPAHPAYPSGHSTYIGAGVTMIKAFANGTLPVVNPVRVNDPNNGDNTVAISSQLTINGELDKLVMNVGVGRLFAGVHWRSDHTAGIRLGELVAIRALQDIARTTTETFTGFDLRRFDGTTVKVTATQVTNNGTPVATSNAITYTP